MIEEKLCFDQGRYHRARIGFILLDTEQTVEGDASAIAPEGVGMFFTRIPTIPEITPESLLDLGNYIPQAVNTLLPDTVPDVVCFTCSSGAIALGDDQVDQMILKERPGIKAITASRSSINAFRALNTRKISVITSYTDAVNTHVQKYLEDHGIEVINMAGMQLETDHEIIRVTPECIKNLVINMDHGDADAVFIGCGALRAMEIAQVTEDALGIPVVTSNQAMIWDCLRLGDVNDKIPGFGKLFLT